MQIGREHADNSERNDVCDTGRVAAVAGECTYAFRLSGKPMTGVRSKVHCHPQQARVRIPAHAQRPRFSEPAGPIKLPNTQPPVSPSTMTTAPDGDSDAQTTRKGTREQFAFGPEERVSLPAITDMGKSLSTAADGSHRPPQNVYIFDVIDELEK
ncbi:hypothetical protein EVAR_83501_1 [Eumeta japonica]|uniref:Uncharacterized protein n=1 Tax=Eumeta variegata TaxID=151549 RepID=A0A4C1XYS7_EUMVA|nr:hypothetical protein EVAR_83501_1 [Eumeta japonica]